MADSGALDGRKILVVGASAGIGQATATALVSAGAAVAAASRRGPLVLDVRDPESCAAGVDTAVAELGGLDAVVYTAGINHLAPLADTSASTWQELLATNLVGAALVVGAAMPTLRAASGRVVICSSHAVPDPWPMLGAYLTSKAALDELVECFRVDEPAISWCRLVVGPTLTGMADGWDPALAAQAFERWAAEGRLDGIEPVAADVVARRITDLLAATAMPPTDSMLADAQPARET